jgi:phospholipase C
LGETRKASSNIFSSAVSMASLRTAFFALAFAAAVIGGSLVDVKHVVMIMFENRSFDHVCHFTFLCFSTREMLMI